MSKIEELIAKYCPDGVEYVLLGDICEIKTGKGITQKDCSEDAKYPVVSGGSEFMGFYNQYNREANTVTISRVGNCGYVNYLDQRFYLNDKCFSVIPFDKGENTKYLYYFLKFKENSIKQLQSEGGVPTINTKKLATIEVPIPPLEIQEEIVRILDKMDNLTLNLEKQLEVRKKQYEWYREKLMKFNSEVNRTMTLGDIGNVCMCKRIMKDETKNVGDIPFYKIGTFGKTADAYISKELYEDYKHRFSFPKIGDILISASGTIGRTVVYDGKPAYFQDSNIVWINNDESIVSNKYLCYLYGIIDWKTEGGTIKRLYNENLKSTKIQIPNKDKQQDIVLKLDKMVSLQENLERMIVLRKKQYEYYREKLLNFKRI